MQTVKVTSIPSGGGQGSSLYLSQNFSLTEVLSRNTSIIHRAHSSVGETTVPAQQSVFQTVSNENNMVRRKPKRRSVNNAHVSHAKSKTNVLTSKRLEKRKYNYVLREIKHLQNTVHLLIPKVAFSRVVREVIFDLFPNFADMRIHATAMEALQEATEAYLVQFFEDCKLVTMHANRVTLQVQDVRLLRRLRGRDDVANR